MNDAVKKMWVEALRSGDFEQGHNRLRAYNTFCCLGVLCELAVRNDVIPEPRVCGSDDNETEGTFVYGGPDDEEVWFLPVAVQKWAGVETYAPIVEGDSVAYLNDNGKTFTEIADLIDRKL